MVAAGNPTGWNSRIPGVTATGHLGSSSTSMLSLQILDAKVFTTFAGSDLRGRSPSPRIRNLVLVDDVGVG